MKPSEAIIIPSPCRELERTRREHGRSLLIRVCPVALPSDGKLELLSTGGEAKWGPGFNRPPFAVHRSLIMLAPSGQSPQAFGPFNLFSHLSRAVCGIGKFCIS